MGVICNRDQKMRKEKEKNESEIDEGQQTAKQRIVEIKANMRMLKDEIKDLKKKLEETNGENIEEFEKEDIEIELSNKIDEYNDLKDRKQNYMINLKEIKDIEKDNEFDEDLDKFKIIYEKNKPNSEKIVENTEDIKNKKKQTEIRRRKIKEANNINNNEKQRKENINKFFNKK